jgi:hypothetical protein
MRLTQCPDCDLTFSTVVAWQEHKLHAHKGPRPARTHERDDLRSLRIEQRFHRYQLALKELRAFIERFTPGSDARRTPLITDQDRDEMVRLHQECHTALEAWWSSVHDASNRDDAVSDPVVRNHRPRP